MLMEGIVIVFSHSHLFDGNIFVSHTSLKQVFVYSHLHLFDDSLPVNSMPTHQPEITYTVVVILYILLGETSNYTLIIWVEIIVAVG